MRSVGVGLATLLLAAAPASAEVFRTHVHGEAALATFFDISDDGCVETTGVIAAVSTKDGTFALVDIDRWNYCTDTGEFYVGGGEVAFSSTGLASATATGSVVAFEYTGHGLPDITVDFSLAWTGTGPISAEASHFASGGGGTTVAFSASRTRNATVSGSVSIDGVDATPSAGQLLRQTAGELVVVH